MTAQRDDARLKRPTPSKTHLRIAAAISFLLVFSLVALDGDARPLPPAAAPSAEAPHPFPRGAPPLPNCSYSAGGLTFDLSAFGASGIKAWHPVNLLWTYHAIVCPPLTPQRLSEALTEHWRDPCPLASALQVENKPSCHALSVGDARPSPALLPGGGLGLALTYPSAVPKMLSAEEAFWNRQQPVRTLIVELECLSDACSATRVEATEVPGRDGLPGVVYVIRVASPWGCPLECPRGVGGAVCSGRGSCVASSDGGVLCRCSGGSTGSECAESSDAVNAVAPPPSQGGGSGGSGWGRGASWGAVGLAVLLAAAACCFEVRRDASSGKSGTAAGCGATGALSGALAAAFAIAALVVTGRRLLPQPGSGALQPQRMAAQPPAFAPLPPASHVPPSVPALAPFSLIAIPAGVKRADHLAAHWSCPFPKKRISCTAQRHAALEAARRPSVCLWEGNTGEENLGEGRAAASLASRVVFEDDMPIRWERRCAARDALFAVGSIHGGTYPALRAYPLNRTYGVLLTMEPPSLQPDVYRGLDAIAPHFDVALSLVDPRFLREAGEAAQSVRDDKFSAFVDSIVANADVRSDKNIITWSYGSSLVPFPEWGMKPKSRLCALVASLKVDTAGHRFRQLAARTLQCLRYDCDVLGVGYSLLHEKRSGHEAYMFSIVIENDRTEGSFYFSEKVVDALSQGSVVVYWGPPRAAEVFGPAVIPFGTIEELEAILPALSPALYEERKPHVEQAMQAARDYVPPEKWLWANVFECAFAWHAAHPEECEED